MTALPRLSPRSQAVAYRAWSWCNDHGWAHTLDEIGDAIGVSRHVLIGVFQVKGWLGRVKLVSGSEMETRMAKHCAWDSSSFVDDRDLDEILRSA